VNSYHNERICAVLVPQLAHYTGDLDVHDLASDAQGQLMFINTLFSCIAAASTTHSFRPLWRPRFISRLAAEDRCHLNRFALRDGGPVYVTAVAETDVADGWRDNRAAGGVVIDAASNEVVCRGRSMPHSPRLHDIVTAAARDHKGNSDYYFLQPGIAGAVNAQPATDDRHRSSTRLSKKVHEVAA